MTDSIKVLLQTTIPASVNDWHVGRFSMLANLLAAQRSVDGGKLFEVVARNREAVGRPDSVLSTLEVSAYDEMWLFAVDTGDGLEAEDLAGIQRFRERGGGLLLTRDHMDLGCSICELPEIGAAHIFHTHNLASGHVAPPPDDEGTPSILWPNFHSGSNGDYQEIVPLGWVHPLLHHPGSPTGVVTCLPCHPHEGAVIEPAGVASARAIARGVSKTTGNPFNVAIAFERTDRTGPAIAQSTFHHFADYNWNPAMGCPDFVTETPGGSLPRTPEAMASVERYVLNAAHWLASRVPAG